MKGEFPLAGAQLCASTVTQPWYWRSLPLWQCTGSEVFAALFRPDSHPEAIATLLESPYPAPEDRSQLARYSICAGAPRFIDGQMQLWTPPVGEVLPFLEQLLQRKGAGGAGEQDQFTIHNSQFTINSKFSRLPTPDSLPFTGGWLGWLGYDLAWEIEKLPYTRSDSLPFPTAYWYEPECFAVLNHSEQILWLAASAPQQLDELQERLEKSEFRSQKSEVGVGEEFPAVHSPLLTTTQLRGAAKRLRPLLHYSLLTHQEEYETAVRKAKKYIQAGDIFQANLSLRFEASTIASSWQIYQALQQINPSPFASYWQTPWGAVISCSPERLVQLQRCGDGNFRVSTRPIAGTRSRGATPEQDRDLAQELLCNTKEIAEHIMLVDLERNDLGRVCQWGSVVVDELLAIERYSHVMHLVSNITGMLKPEYDAIDLIRAVFPGGTITGCPKVRCMEIIEELEPVRRSLFYGSCGYLDWRGNLDLNILIRTLLYGREQGAGSREQGAGKECQDFSPSATSAPSVPSDVFTDSRFPNASSTRRASTGGTPRQLLQWGEPPQRTGSATQPLHNGGNPRKRLAPPDSLNTVWGQVGAGIVADSDPEREWYESLHKAQAQLIALRQAEEGSRKS